MVELVKIYVAKQLRCEVANWQTAIIFCKKQAFCLWQTSPIVFLSFYDALFSGVVKYGFFNKIEYKG
jgi:hypothetical protein